MNNGWQSDDWSFSNASTKNWKTTRREIRSETEKYTAGTEERQKALLLESEGQQAEECKQEAEEHKCEAGDIKTLIQEQKQMQEHYTAELGLLRGDVGELRGELNNQITRIN